MHVLVAALFLKQQTMKKINVFGEELTIKFNMGVQIAFEKISDKPFYDIDFKKAENRLVLYTAAIIHNNPKSSITIDTLLNASQEELIMIDEAISGEMDDWYHIPSACNDNEEVSEEEEKV